MPRVVAGTARGIPLKTLAGEATRPTSDRAKEAVFSSLGQRVLDTEVLDLCAGSGQLGIEALSRGAASAVFVDQSRAACGVIRENLAKTALSAAGEIRCQEVLGAARSLLAARRTFDLIFFDPPYAAAEKLLPSLAQLLEEGLLNRDGILVTEQASRGFSPPQGLKLQCFKRCQYGAAMVSFYNKATAEKEDLTY